MIRLAVRVARADAEVVLAALLDLAPSGLEERDCGPDTVEYALYGAPGELPVLPAVRATVGDALVEIDTSELPDDWSQRWRQFHRPVLIEPPVSGASRPGTARGPAAEAQPVLGVPLPALHVRPPWCEPCGRDDAIELVIDPGQAFGTGAHATTRLCLELLLEVCALGVGGELIDVGTGSGVLAIAASMLGFAPVSALDNDPASVDAATRNAQVAGAAITVAPFDLRVQTLEWGSPPVVCANLVRPLLVDLAATLPSAPAHLVAGGLLAGEVDAVSERFCTHVGMRERERRSQGEWAALWLSAP